MGVDPSTKTGLVMLANGETYQRVVQFPSLKGYARLQSIAETFEETFAVWAPTVVVIEGYAFANRFTLADLVEIGSAMRLVLHKSKVPWYIAPPSLLKRFVSGSGVTKKPGMAAAVRDRWGFESPSDDLVDAYGLAKIGQTLGVFGSGSISGVTHG